MRTRGALVVAGLVGLFPAYALAHPSSGGAVHDHRSSSSSGGGGPTFHDHRSSDATPTVRDHRSSEPTAIRDHRGADATYVAGASEEPMVVDGGAGGGVAVDDGHVPTWRLELGGLARRFRGPDFVRSGVVDGDPASAYVVSGGTPTAGDTASAAMDLRMTVAAGAHLYGGAEVELGGLTRSPIQMMSGSPDLHIASRSLVGGMAVLGTRARQGIVEIDGEVAGGVRVLSTSIQAIDASDEDPSGTEAIATGVLEGRVRAAVWVAPRFFIGAEAGMSALDRGDVSIGLTIGTALRPYGEPFAGPPR